MFYKKWLHPAIDILSKFRYNVSVIKVKKTKNSRR